MTAHCFACGRFMSKAADGLVMMGMVSFSISEWVCWACRETRIDLTPITPRPASITCYRTLERVLETDNERDDG